MIWRPIFNETSNSKLKSDFKKHDLSWLDSAPILLEFLAHFG